MLTFPLPPDLELRPLGHTDAGALAGVLAAHRSAFDRWLRWSGGIRGEADAAAFLQEFAGRQARGDGFNLGLWCGADLLGGVICWYIHPVHHSAEVGYWLVPPARGRGLATEATRRVIQHLFEHQQLHRVELQCAVDNEPSRQVAKRLGATLEGIRRESHWLTTRFVDHAVYGVLAHEWPVGEAGRAS